MTTPRTAHSERILTPSYPSSQEKNSYCPQKTYGNGPDGVDLGHLNPMTDNHVDMVIANELSNTVVTFFGDGKGKFHMSQVLTLPTVDRSYDLLSGPAAVMIGNFNHDKHPDILVANEVSPRPRIPLTSRNPGSHHDRDCAR